MVDVYSIESKQTPEEFWCGKCKTEIKEMCENHDFVGIRSRKWLTASRTPPNDLLVRKNTMHHHLFNAASITSEGAHWLCKFSFSSTITGYEMEEFEEYFLRNKMGMWRWGDARLISAEGWNLGWRIAAQRWTLASAVHCVYSCVGWGKSAAVSARKTKRPLRRDYFIFRVSGNATGPRSILYFQPMIFFVRLIVIPWDLGVFLLMQNSSQ